MVSWLPHILIPGLFALAFLRALPRKWVMWLAPVAWLPDLDFISNALGLPGHRALTHNVWVPALLLLASWLAWRRGPRDLPYAKAALRPGWPLGLLLASYYWASHVLLDVFAGGAVLLWPLLNINFYVLYEVHFDLSSGKVEPVAEGGTEVGPPTPSSDYTWLSFEHTATLAFLAVAGAATLVVWLRRRRARPSRPPSRRPSTKGK